MVNSQQLYHKNGARQGVFSKERTAGWRAAAVLAGLTATGPALPLDVPCDTQLRRRRNGSAGFAADRLVQTARNRPAARIRKRQSGSEQIVSRLIWDRLKTAYPPPVDPPPDCLSAAPALSAANRLRSINMPLPHRLLTRLCLAYLPPRLAQFRAFRLRFICRVLFAPVPSAPVFPNLLPDQSPPGRAGHMLDGGDPPAEREQECALWRNSQTMPHFPTTVG